MSAVRQLIRHKTRVILILITFIALSGLYYQVNADHCQHQDVIIDREEPTEDFDGFVTYKCKLCGRKYTDTLFAVKHEWSDWVVEKQPTTTEPGLRSRTCNRGLAHTEWEEIPPLENGTSPESTSEKQVNFEAGALNQNPGGEKFSYIHSAIAVFNSGISFFILCKLAYVVCVSCSILYRYKERIHKNQMEYLRHHEKEKETWD